MPFGVRLRGMGAGDCELNLARVRDRSTLPFDFRRPATAARPVPRGYHGRSLPSVGVAWKSDDFTRQLALSSVWPRIHFRPTRFALSLLVG